MAEVTASAQHVEEKAPQNGAAQLAQQAPKAPLSFMPQSWDDAFRIAKYLSESALLPDALRGKEKLYDVLYIIATGQEFGLSPIQAIREITIVKGKPYLSALLRVALVKQSPACEYFRLVESTPLAATYETKRKGEGVTKLTYTLDEAKKAGLVGRVDKDGKLLEDNWNRDPALMLRRRCEGRLADEVYSDVTRGSYNKEDLEDRSEREVNPIPLRSVGPTIAPPAPYAEVVEMQAKPRKVADVPSQADAVREPVEMQRSEASSTPPAMSEYELLCIRLKECATAEQVDTLMMNAQNFKGEPGERDTLAKLGRERRKALESKK